MGRNGSSEGHSRPGERRGDKSGHEKKLSEQGEPTSWRAQREGQIRTRKQTGRARATHVLVAERRQVRTRKQTEQHEGHLLPGEHRWRVKSGHGNKPSEQGALTNWKAKREG